MMGQIQDVPRHQKLTKYCETWYIILFLDLISEEEF